MDRFIIERSTLKALEGTLFLKGQGKFSEHCHLIESVKMLLDSKHFKKRNPNLIPIFEKAKKMMDQNMEGVVYETMKKSVIIGQFLPEQIKRLFRSETRIPFTTETDLTMVHWPLEDGQTDGLKTPISEPGKKWVIAAQSDKDEILKILN